VLAARKNVFGTASNPTTSTTSPTVTAPGPGTTSSTRRGATTTRRGGATGPQGTYDGTEGSFTCSGDAECDDVTPSDGEYVVAGSGSSATIKVPGVGTIPAIDARDCAKDLDVEASDVAFCFAGRVDGAKCLGQKTSDLYVVAIPPQEWGAKVLAVSGRVADNTCGKGVIAGRLTLERSD
jgi:hypothetical protein